MEVFLVDTSVWINFFKANETASSSFLKSNMSNVIIATCPVIVQEVLQGVASDNDLKLIRSYFGELTKLIGEPYALATEAAILYRTLRAKGVTIRKPNDCLIAVFAIMNNIILMADDKDFEMIAKYSSLKLFASKQI